MNRLPIERQIQVVSCLIEGNSIRATVRMTGASNDAIQRLMAALVGSGNSEPLIPEILTRSVCGSKVSSRLR